MKHQFTFENPKEAVHGLVKAFVNPDFRPDYTRGTVSWIDDVEVIINNPCGPMDLGQVDFTPQRWVRFIREYINFPAMSEFIARLGKLGRAQELAYQTPLRAGHNLGNCLISISARERKNKEVVITMFSRTTILIPTGSLDLYLLSLIGEYAQKVLGKKVQLRWWLTQLQMTSWKALPYIWNQLLAEPEYPWAEILDNPENTGNKYLEMLKDVNRQAHKPELLAQRYTYRTPRRQTFRMQSVKSRFENNQIRTLTPTIQTILDPKLLSEFEAQIPENEEEDED